MSDHKPTKPYVYQRYGMQDKDHWSCGRIYAVSVADWRATIKGLTKAEAEVVLDALIKLHAREELTRIGQQIGDYTGADGKQHPIINL